MYSKGIAANKIAKSCCNCKAEIYYRVGCFVGLINKISQQNRHSSYRIMKEINDNSYKYKGLTNFCHSCFKKLDEVDID